MTSTLRSSGLLSPAAAELKQESSSRSKQATPVSSTPVSPIASRDPSPVRLPSTGQSLSIAERRGQPGNGMRVANGILHPPHMIEPHLDGYRTPMGEDYEDHFASRKDNLKGSQSRGERAQTPKKESGNLLYLQPSPARSRLSINALSDRLDEKIEWKQRVRHFTWNFFSMTMATGGIANVLHSGMLLSTLSAKYMLKQLVPYRFNGLDTIGTIFFLFNFCLFLANVTLISMRFIKWPETLRASVTHPTESLFMPSAIVSLGTVLLNICQYGLGNVGPWLGDACFVLFWIYTCFAIMASTCTYLLMWSTQTFTIAQMTPIWIFPAYPLLIVGPLAGFLSANLDTRRALDIIVGGFTCQGIGYLVSMTIYSAFIYRLMTQKLPKEAVRPGMFVSVGPSGFTAGAVINMAASAAQVFPPDFLGDGRLAATIVKVVADFMALWIWGLAIWFFIVSVGAHWTYAKHRHQLHFSMTYFSFVFPNTALVTATFAVGKAFNSSPIQWVGCVATVLIVGLWMFVFSSMIRAIVLKHILWPQKQDDRDEGGFTAPRPRAETMKEKKASPV